VKLIEDYNFPKEVFGHKLNRDLIWEVVRAYLYNQRQGKASTKTRAEVSGGGRKPWRQKGTGRARQGSIRSPLWRGGGVVFGPRPREFQLKMPKRKKRLALLQSLSHMYQEQRIKIIDGIDLPQPKTRLLFDLIKSLDLADKKVLIVVPRKDPELSLAARNIPNIEVEQVDGLNTYQVLNHDYLLFTHEAIETGVERWKSTKS